VNLFINKFGVVQNFQNSVNVSKKLKTKD